MIYIILLVVLLWGIIYALLVRKNDFFKVRGIPFLKPSLGFGNVRNAFLLKEPLGSIHQKIYEKFKGYRYCGYFVLTEPSIFLIDVELIKNILIRDFASFNDNAVDWDESNEKYICKSPFVLTGDDWKLGRSLLTPAFSTSRIKSMFECMLISATRFLEYASTQPEVQKGICVDIKKLCSRYCVDSVTGSVLSLNIHEYTKESSEFHKMGKRIFGSTSVLDDLRFLFGFWMPKTAQFLNMRFVDYKVGAFFTSLLRNLQQHRTEHKLQLNDFLEYLRSVQQSNPDYSDYHIVANILTFLTDGYEASSRLIANCLYEFARNPETQRKAQQEIDGIFKTYDNHPLCYKMVQEMKYLELAILETLRMHPSTAVFKKRCVKSYQLPPAKDGECPSFEIPVGMVVHIPVTAIMMDPDIYEEPEKFVPDRFNDERKYLIPEGAYFGFGVGPRKCVGQRFVMAQIKVGLASLLRNYNLRVNSKTQTPLQVDPHSTFLNRPLKGIWLDMKKRNIE